MMYNQLIVFGIHGNECSSSNWSQKTASPKLLVKLLVTYTKTPRDKWASVQKDINKQIFKNSETYFPSLAAVK